MRRFCKIALISLSSLLVLAVLVVVVALWLVLTPARLTSIVNDLSGRYLRCESHFETVDLTLFKTWPNVGIDIKDVVLVNPYTHPDDTLFPQAIHTDTLACISSLTLGMDIKAFLADRSIVLRQLRLDNAQANIFTDQTGWTNTDIFAHSADSTSDEDDTSSSLPTNIQIEKIAIHHLSAQYCDLHNRMFASIDDFGTTVSGSLQDVSLDAKLHAKAGHLMAQMIDSIGATSLLADIAKADINLKAQSDNNLGTCRLTVQLPMQSLQAGSYELPSPQTLDLDATLGIDLDSYHVRLDKVKLALADIHAAATGTVQAPHDNVPLSMDVNLEVEPLDIAPTLPLLPASLRQSISGFDTDGKLSLSAHAVGTLQGADSMPTVDAQLSLSKGRFSATKMLPVSLRGIDAALSAHLVLTPDSSGRRDCSVEIQNLKAITGKSTLKLKGTVKDLLDDMLVDARLNADVYMPDVAVFLPDTMPATFKGRVGADVTAYGRLSNIKDKRFDRLKANARLSMSNVDVVYDSLHISSPALTATATLPQGKVSLKGSLLQLDKDNATLAARVDDPAVHVSLPGVSRLLQGKGKGNTAPLPANFEVSFSHIHAELDSSVVYSDTLSIAGVAKLPMDEAGDNTGIAATLRRFSPDVDIDLSRLVLAMPNMSEAVRMPSFRFHYEPGMADIAQADILWGVSDYHLAGKVYALEDWLDHRDMLQGSLNFSSQYADIDQLMNLISGMGSDKDTLEQQRKEDDVPPQANPFIVPLDVNVRLNTDINRCVAFGNDLNQLGGSVTINDGIAILDQIGFTCKAARMQLTAVYESPRVNNLGVGLDFHLLDINIDELLDMIPTIDTLVPMLSAFKGNADFHLAANCNLDAFYHPKMSTLIGAAAISGKDLVVIDNESMANIARLLQFKNWREHDNNLGVDSISVEAQVFRKEVTVYPFLLNLHNYQLCIGGMHNLAGQCNYHLELLRCPLPMRLAVDVRGTLSKPQIELGKVRYADLYVPERSDALERRTLELKRLVRQHLEANVR